MDTLWPDLGKGAGSNNHRRTQALAQYERLGEALSERLGTEASASTRHLYSEIAAGRFPPSKPTAPAVEEPLRQAIRGDGFS